MKKLPAILFFLIVVAIILHGGPGRTIAAGSYVKNIHPELTVKHGQFPHEEINFTKDLSTQAVNTSNGSGTAAIQDQIHIDRSAAGFLIVPQGDQIKDDENPLSRLILIFPYHQFW